LNCILSFGWTEAINYEINPGLFTALETEATNEATKEYSEGKH